MWATSLWRSCSRWPSGWIATWSLVVGNVKQRNAERKRTDLLLVEHMREARW